ncbi:alkene reductase [Streptomyces sp. NPDC091281]|uniref:alkene reductase n=1 Tax=Streptomyces sp. NPDC091281 TaxID=3365985 RepID=UPI0038222BED
MSDLFSPVTVGKWELRNRVVMAPMTRSRARRDGVPGPHAATYYAQRASAGLIVTEGTQPSAVGQGYFDTPGLHTAEHVAGWREIADAVHAQGGLIVTQLMHVGRVAHPDNKNGLESVAPSAVRAPGEIFTRGGMKEFTLPRALEESELASVIGEFVASARAAREAGLDGVELHAANGYLLHQFLGRTSNLRTDGYGGSPAARARFVVEVTRAVAEAIGAERVGIRISPSHDILGVVEDDPADTLATYGALIDGIAPLGLAYLHVLADPASDLVRELRVRFGGPLLANDGFGSVTTDRSAAALLTEGLADAVAVGRPFLANPDLVRRWREGLPLTADRPDLYYGGDATGYTDFPTADA